jgi:PAS domain S-box-containing protein
LDATRPTRRALELAAVVESVNDPVFSVSLEGTISSWNDAADELYGYRADEIIGKPVEILAPPDRADEIDEILGRLRRGEAMRRFETVRRRKDGSDLDVSLSISPLRGPSGDVVGASTVTHDISEQKRREEIQGFLLKASRLFSANLDYRQTLSRVANLMLSNLADLCVVETTDASGSFIQVAVAHHDAAKAELARELRRLYPARPNRPDIPLRVLTTSKAELVPNVTDALLENIAQNADHLRMLRELGSSSVIVVPLRTRGRAFGTILLANAESSRRYDEEDLRLAEDLARRAALAIDNAALHKSEHDARRKAERAVERVGRLQAITAAVSGAVTPRAVAEVLVGQGAAAVGADGGFVRLLAADEEQLELVATMGISDDFARSYSKVALTSPLPDAAVFRNGAQRYFESSAAVRAASPEFAREHLATGHEAIAFVPLHGLRGTIGVMALSFAAPRMFDDEDRNFLKALAGQCTQALERARLYEAERRARAAAELAIERTMRLQGLAAELAEALTSAQVAEVVVDRGIASIDADAGALQLLSEDGKTLKVVAGQGSDRSLIDEEWREFSVELNLPSNDALRALEPVFIESDDYIRTNYPRERAERAAALPARAGAHIPLVSSGHALGVLFLGFTQPRRFSESQRSFALAIGRQCAQALMRAQLYEAELEGRNKLSRLVERLHEGVVSVDRRGRIDFASSKAKQMLGEVSLEEGRQVPAVWLGFPLRNFVAKLFAGDERIVEAQVVSDDRARVFSVTGIPAARSETVLVVVTDVSERERRRRAEREFVDNAAHELRTPLAAITSAIERLQAGAREVPEKRDRFLGHIQRESARLNHLASSLLVLARAQTREEEPRREEVTLCEVLEELTAHLEPKQGVELVLDCPAELVVSTNRDLLEHALSNLIGNAVHHTDAGQIKVSVHPDDEGSLMIEVSDTGIGIAPEELGRLFDRFYRGPTEKGRAGVGLGLPITKDAVEALGGRVEVESVRGTGTTARIVLPHLAAAVPS